MILPLRQETSVLKHNNSNLINSRGFRQLQIAFKVGSDLKALDTVLSHFEQVYQPWIPKKDWLQCQLALAEGFTNAVRHAHKGLPADLTIDIELTISPWVLEIRIWDYGQPFDLESFLRKNADRDNRWSGHGQGLPILRQIADKLSYIRTDHQRNCLIIIKRFSLEEQQE